MNLTNKIITCGFEFC